MTRHFMAVFSAAFLALALFHLSSGNVQAFDKNGCEMDCQKCHTITNQEIKEILKNLKAPDAEVVNVQLSPIRALWEVSINNKGRSGLFYVDFSKNYILSGSVIEIKTGRNMTRDRIAKLEESRRFDFSKVPVGQALVLGDAASPQKVAVFTDPD